MKTENNSLDPRIKQLDLESSAQSKVGEKEYWITWEVFHQDKRGNHHEHQGSVHAPEAELALVFAKEQFGRRKKCVNIWVVRTDHVFTFSYSDEDMFESAVSPEKSYREANGFKVRDRISEYKKKNKIEVKVKGGVEGYFGGITET